MISNKKLYKNNPYGRAKEYFFKKDYANAIVCSYIALQQDPGSYAIKMILGESYIMKGNYDKGLKIIYEILPQIVKHDEIFMKARKLITNILPKDLSISGSIQFLRYKKNDLYLRSYLKSESIKLLPKPISIKGLVVTLLIDPEDKEAISLLKSACLNLFPDIITMRGFIQILRCTPGDLNALDCLKELCKIQKYNNDCIIGLTTVLRNDPNNLEILNLLKKLCIEAGPKNSTVDGLIEYIKTHNEDYEAIITLARYCIDIKKYTEAIDYLSMAIKVKPSAINPYKDIIKISFQEKNFYISIYYFRKLIQRDVSCYRYYYDIAKKCYEKLCNNYSEIQYIRKQMEAGDLCATQLFGYMNYLTGNLKIAEGLYKYLYEKNSYDVFVRLEMYYVYNRYGTFYKKEADIARQFVQKNNSTLLSIDLSREQVNNSLLGELCREKKIITKASRERSLEESIEDILKRQFWESDM